MAVDFDEFPVYDQIAKKENLYLSDIWLSSIATFYQTLIGYLTQNGILAPTLTDSERDKIQSPVNGQIIYNTTLNKFQGFENGSWVNFV